MFLVVSLLELWGPVVSWVWRHIHRIRRSSLIWVAFKKKNRWGMSTQLWRLNVCAFCFNDLLCDITCLIPGAIKRLPFHRRGEAFTKLPIRSACFSVSICWCLKFCIRYSIRVFQLKKWPLKWLILIYSSFTSQRKIGKRSQVTYIGEGSLLHALIGEGRLKHQTSNDVSHKPVKSVNS